MSFTTVANHDHRHHRLLVLPAIAAMAIAMVVIIIVFVFVFVIVIIVIFFSVFLAFVHPVLFPLLFLHLLLRFFFFFSSCIPRTLSGLFPDPCSPSRVCDELRLRLRPVTGPLGS
jgi:hypothetical protein